MKAESIAYKHVGIIGAGAWGTALGAVAALAGRKVTLWAREPAVVDSVNSKHENVLFLPGVALPATIAATADQAVAAKADALLIGAPAQHLRATLAQLKLHLRAGKIGRAHV